MNIFNVYLTGVGGQGIGLLSEVILRAADHANLPVKSVDTHGLAQRGGVVISQIRMGQGIFSPLIPAGCADLAVSLERHEALRAAAQMVKDGGSLIYYNTVWQPLPVRLGEAPEVNATDIEKQCRRRGISLHTVFDPQLVDVRMQNMAVLGTMAAKRLIPAIATDHYHKAMADLMTGAMLTGNRQLFDAHRAA